MRELEADVFTIYTEDATGVAGTLRLGHTTGTQSGESIAIDNKGNVSVGRNEDSDSASQFGVDQLIDGTERLALDRGLVFKMQNNETNAIRWRRPAYTTASLEVKPIDTSNWSRSGLGFFTKDAADDATGPLLRLGISQTGKVVIGSNDDFSSYTEHLRVEGATNILGTLTTSSSVALGGEMSVGGIVTLSDALTVEGLIHAKGGIDVDGPYTVSGLTNKGTLTTQGNQGSQHLIDLTYLEEKPSGNIIHDKGSIHLDGLLNAILDLNNSDDKSWAKLTPSGSYLNTTDFAIGTTTHPDSVLFGTTLTTQGLGPGLILRNTAGLGTNEIGQPVGQHNRDWYMGAGATGDEGEYNRLYIGRFAGSPNNLQHLIQMKASGKMSFGSNINIDEDYTYTFGGPMINTYAITSTAFLQAPSLRIAKDENDTEFLAGFNSSGKLTIGGPRQNSYNLKVNDAINVFGANPKYTLSDPSGGEVSSLEHVNETFTIKNAGLTILESTPGSGLYTPELNSDDVTVASTFNSGGTATIKDLNVTGSTTISGPTNSLEDFTLSGNSAAKFGIHVSGENVYMEGVSNTDFRIGVGMLGTQGAGLKVLTEKATGTTPSNIRIHDISPVHELPNENKTLITLRWNWEKIAGTGATTTDDAGNDIATFTPSAGAAAWTLENGDAATADDLINKRWSNTTSSGTSTFTISAYDESTGAITLVGLAAERDDTEDGIKYDGSDPIGPNYSKVHEECDTIAIECIEMTADGYHLPEHEVISFTIPFDYIDTNTHSFKLPINSSSRKWFLRMQGIRGGVYGTWQEMSSGSYDPDQSGGQVSGQAVVDYDTPFRNELPWLDPAVETSPGNVADNQILGSISLTPSEFGFNVSIGGWDDPTADGSQPDKTAQSFQFGYTTNSSFDWNDTNSTVYINTASRNFNVNAVANNSYLCGVRPKQNTQIVGNTKIGTVQSGAGGVPPSYMNVWAGNIAKPVYKGTFVDITDTTITGTLNYLTIFNDGINFTDTPFYNAATISGFSMPQDYLAPTASMRMHIENAARTSTYGYTFILGHDPVALASNGLCPRLEVSTMSAMQAGWQTAGNVWSMGCFDKGARRVAAFSLTANIRIKMICVSVNQITNATAEAPAILRVYQASRETEAASVSLTQVGTFNQEVDVEIHSDNGAICPYRFMGS